MNKVLIALLIFGAGAFVIYLLGGNSDALPGWTSSEDTATYEEAYESLKEDGPRKIVGSCNVIAEKSTCVDYVGSMWGDNNMGELNCGEAGSYTKNQSCPYSEFGGCRTGAGTVMEMVIWAYREGPGGYDEESVPYAAGACNANPAADWVTAEAFDGIQ